MHAQRDVQSYERRPEKLSNGEFGPYEILTARVDFNKFNIILQMNQTMDVREMFKAAVGEQGKNFVRGTTSTDAHRFFRHVSKMHFEATGLLVVYKFKQLGFNNDWDMHSIESNLCRPGKYVFFGATRKNNDTHKRLQTSITAQHSDSDKLDTWIKGKQILNDHAIGVDVDTNMNGTIYDNGCTAGEKNFSIQNLATRMRWMNQCFLMDLYVIKS